jgi:uncharacterized damage-inducible protein DinB
MIIFKEQYELVKDSRSVLFKYCDTISEEDFVKADKSFGRGGSIRNILVHIANTYQYWIGGIIMKMEMEYSEYDTIKNIHDVRRLYENINKMMSGFFDKSPGLKDEKFKYKINGVEGIAGTFKIITHVMTHEFHHKGQVLSLSRKLGYIPVDTDIMR